MPKLIATILFILFTLNLSAFELKVEKVVDNTYALVGEIGPRSKENLAILNSIRHGISSI